jgi:hypothetical protein
MFEAYGDTIASDTIERFIALKKNWEWITYVVIPLFYLLKFSLISAILSIGVLLSNLKYDFKALFRSVVFAEYTFLIPIVLKLMWFGFVFQEFKLDDLRNFAPFSLYSILNNQQIDDWLNYPLQKINLFELFYWIALAYQLKPVLNENLSGSLAFVGRTYGVGLVIWIILVMFLMVSIS